MKERVKFSKWFKYKAIAVVSALLGFAYILWYAHYTHIDNINEADLPIATAPTNVIVKPKNPGGMIVPNKDKDIYNYMSGRKKLREKEEPKVLEAKESNLSKSEILFLIKKQLGLTTDKSYYLRIARLKSAEVFDQAVKIIKAKHPELNSLHAKLYHEIADNGQLKYYLHMGSIKNKKQATSMCNNLNKTDRSCTIFSE